MYFTKEDYEKIEKWLQKKSIKDSDFEEAIYFNGREYITIVQDGYNRKVRIKDFIDYLFTLEVTDFINVSGNYSAPNISLRQAISYIPSKARKKGQVITFSDEFDNWKIYQFSGELSQWNNPELWKDLLGIANKAIDSILPDEEDLTASEIDDNGNVYLKFRDKAYNFADFSGLGRKILRKNIITVEDPTYGLQTKNLLTQEDFGHSYTIYDIKYNFDLNGKSLVIPEKCVLNFCGGSITNGRLLLNGAYVEGVLGDISSVITADIEGTYGEGQCLYDKNLKRPKWWTGTNWVDGSGQTIS